MVHPGSDGEDKDEVESDETKKDEKNDETPEAETATSLLESEPELDDSDSVSDTPNVRPLEYLERDDESKMYDLAKVFVSATDSPRRATRRPPAGDRSRANRR